MHLPRLNPLRRLAFRLEPWIPVLAVAGLLLIGDNFAPSRAVAQGPHVYLPLAGRWERALLRMPSTAIPTRLPTERATDAATATPTPLPRPSETSTLIPPLSPTPSPSVPSPSLTPPSVRPFPDSSERILVFNDQLAGSMTDAQYRFSAQHYVGTQKVLQKDARRLRAVNPDFLILHYRLGQALGHSMPAAGCAPSTNMIQIVDGNRWVQEWPGDDKVEEEWFYHVQGQRVFSCTNGHFLFDLTNARLKEWWTGEVMRQLEANEDDAVFADSYSVPNYFGACDWKPCLPVVDAAFERDWAQREHDFTDYVRERFAGRWKWIPNIGTLVTTRDPSDYGNIDGAMVEGFAEWGGHRWLDPTDWQLQMNRVLALVAQDKIIITQSYPQPDDVAERMFILGSYLLIKGRHTYVNVDMGLEPEWFPEYSIDLGAAAQPPPARIGALLDARWPLFARRYAKGLVLVNPGTAVQDAALDTPMWRVIPSGGGRVSPDGNVTGTLRYERTGQVAVPPHGAAILFTSNPSR